MIQKIEKTHNAHTYSFEAEKYKGNDVYKNESLHDDQFYESYYESYIDPKIGQIIADEQDGELFWKPLSDEKQKALMEIKVSLWKALDLVSSKEASRIN
jgi:hypothetical protein